MKRNKFWKLKILKVLKSWKFWKLWKIEDFKESIFLKYIKNNLEPKSIMKYEKIFEQIKCGKNNENCKHEIFIF